MSDRPLRIGRLAYEAVMRARGGRVASVFARAANILVDGGDVLALLAADRPLHPWAIAPIEAISSLLVGMVARTDGGTLWAGPLAIPLARAQVVELRLADRPRERPAGATLAVVVAAGERAGESGEDAWGEGQIEGALGTFFADGDVGALIGLVGLGPGLTPAGDDVVLGVLAGLDWAAALAERAGDVRRRLAAGLADGLEQRTSRMSAQMLRAAIGGQYPEPLVELGQAMSEQGMSPEDVRRAAEEVRAIGHRSGPEMLRGFGRAVEWAAVSAGGDR